MLQVYFYRIVSLQRLDRMDSLYHPSFNLQYPEPRALIYSG